MSDNDITGSAPDENEGQALPPVTDQPPDVGHVSSSVPPRTPADDNDEALNALREATITMRALSERIQALEAEKAARDRADEAARSEVFVHPNTHVLVLSNGTTVETANPSVTHHSDENGIYPVIARHVLNPE